MKTFLECIEEEITSKSVITEYITDNFVVCEKTTLTEALNKYMSQYNQHWNEFYKAIKKTTND